MQGEGGRGQKVGCRVEGGGGGGGEGEGEGEGERRIPS